MNCVSRSLNSQSVACASRSLKSRSLKGASRRSMVRMWGRRQGAGSLCTPQAVPGGPKALAKLQPFSSNSRAFVVSSSS